MSRDRDEEILASSPFEEDFQSALAARAARGRPSKVTLALAAGLLLVAGVLIGIRLHASFGPQDAARPLQGAAVNRFGAPGGRGPAPAGWRSPAARPGRTTAPAGTAGGAGPAEPVR